MRIEAVVPGALDGLLPRLVELLVDSVAHNASVGFLDPLGTEAARDYWGRVGADVADGGCVLLVARDDDGDGTVLGTVQLRLAAMPNQPHRAEVSKLLVHTGARRRGIGEALMRALEDEAVHAGRWLLTLDTATAEADRLYLRLGWTAAGAVPDYALNGDGTLTHTTFYFKRLSGAPRRGVA